MSSKVPSREHIDLALRRAWFPVARLQDLDAPGAAILLGEELAVFRTESGRAAVTSIRSPHRGSDLSTGSVEGEAIVCPYHGWQWRGSDGVCMHVPSLGPRDAIPSKARVRAYPVQERWGLVWTCLDEPANDLPVLPEIDGFELAFACSQEIPQLCGIAAATENFRDVAHFPFVHRSPWARSRTRFPRSTCGARASSAGCRDPTSPSTARARPCGRTTTAP